VQNTSVPLIALALSVTVFAQSAYVPERVFDSAHRKFADFEAMLASVAKADVLFVGEQHDDPNTHYLELAVLEGLARRRTDSVVVGLEMFERDVQESLDHFQMGHTDEPEFLKASRPWPNYVHDYKPLVDFAVKKDWPIFASNVPRSLASDVSKSGLDALKGKSVEEAKWFAADLHCPRDAYFHRFAEAMGAHPDKDSKGSDAARADVDRYYQAQCLKDETMAESVARAYGIASGGGKHPLVVHFNGAFHSDFTEGTAERAKRRLPGTRVVVMTMLPVENLDAISPDKAERKRADYLVYTIKSKK
jgi:uncharacterized iron-regulated protein